MNADPRKNVLLFRWSTANQRRSSWKLGTLLDWKSRKATSQQGYALVSGLRASSLHVGHDLIAQIQDDLARYRASVRKRIVVPTFAVAAANILYFAQDDLAKEVEAELKAPVKQLTNWAGAVRSIDRIELSLIASKLQALSNSGIIEGPAKVSVERIPMHYNQSDLADRMAQNAGWTTFYAVMTSAKDVRDVFVRQRSDDSTSSP